MDLESKNRLLRNLTPKVWPTPHLQQLFQALALTLFATWMLLGAKVGLVAPTPLAALAPSEEVEALADRRHNWRWPMLQLQPFLQPRRVQRFLQIPLGAPTPSGVERASDLAGQRPHRWRLMPQPSP